MSERTDKRRADLRARIVDLAEQDVIASGMQGIKARDLAQRAECSVGAIYNVFDDMTGVVLAVNGRTFQRLGAFVNDALDEAGEVAPAEALVVMGKAYMQFAADNKLAWRALFDVEMSVNTDVPDWYLDEMRGLFAIIARPLSQLHGDKSAEEIGLLTRALFSSIHGIVWLGLEQRISGVPLPQIEAMIETVLSNFSGQGG